MSKNSTRAKKEIEAIDSKHRNKVEELREKKRQSVILKSSSKKKANASLRRPNIKFLMKLKGQRPTTMTNMDKS
jgi:hypothetical protein